jgi:hypothetical protein
MFNFFLRSFIRIGHAMLFVFMFITKVVLFVVFALMVTLISLAINLSEAIESLLASIEKKGSKNAKTKRK